MAASVRWWCRMSNPTVPQLLADRLAEAQLVIVKNDTGGFDIAIVLDGGFTTKAYAESILPFWADVVTKIDERIWL